MIVNDFYIICPYDIRIHMELPGEWGNPKAQSLFEAQLLHPKYLRDVHLTSSLYDRNLHINPAKHHALKLAIMRTRKQIHEEASRVLLGRNKFLCASDTGWMSLVVFIMRLRNLQHLQRTELFPSQLFHGLIRSMSKCGGVGQKSLALVKSLPDGQASLQCGGC